MSVRRYDINYFTIDVIPHSEGRFRMNSDYEALAQKCAKYEEALKEIRDQDYRGNRSTESGIARKALE